MLPQVLQCNPSEVAQRRVQRDREPPIDLGSLVSTSNGNGSGRQGHLQQLADVSQLIALVGDGISNRSPPYKSTQPRVGELAIGGGESALVLLESKEDFTDRSTLRTCMTSAPITETFVERPREQDQLVAANAVLRSGQ